MTDRIVGELIDLGAIGLVLFVLFLPIWLLLKLWELATNSEGY